MPSSARRPSTALILTAFLILVGLALVAFFGLRTFRDYRRVQLRGLTPGVADVDAIRGWMTLPYVAQAYGVPPPAIFERLGIPQGGNETRSIKELADKYNRDPGEVLQTVQDAVRHFLAKPPPPIPPP
jgi:hypothetical protein